MTTKELPPLTLKFTKVEDGLPDRKRSNYCLCVFRNKDHSLALGPAYYEIDHIVYGTTWQHAYEPSFPIDGGVIIAWAYWPEVPQGWIDQLKGEMEAS